MNCELSTRDIGCMNRIPPIKVILVKILVRNVAIIFFCVTFFMCCKNFIFISLCLLREFHLCRVVFLFEYLVETLCECGMCSQRK